MHKIFIDTSDLKKISVVARENLTLTVECQFINGTDALGCVVVLFDSEMKLQNISSTFFRKDSELALQGQLDVSEDVFCYDRVIGFDLESDNTTNNLALPGNLIFEGNSHCTTSTSTTSSPPSDRTVSGT